MNHTPRNTRSSIDGFVPNARGRHVGFQPPVPRKLDSHRLHRVQMRRPSLHNSAAPGQQSSPLTARPVAPGRGNFPEFTTYASPRLNPAGASTRGQTGSTDAGRGAVPAKKLAFFKRINWRKFTKRAGIACAAILLLSTGWLGWKLLHNTAKVFGNGSSLIGFLNATPLKGEDQGRVNILLAGVSSDDPGHEGADLTDSIMIISLDTRNHKAFMLSVPRDLWVSIPGNGHAKINAANVYGDQDNFSEPGYPAGGMGLLEETISQKFQIPIQYYAKVNYTALRTAVDAVGGIQVNIQSSDPRGLYDPNISAADHGPLRLPNGTQTLNGQTALNLARARGDPTFDGRVAYGFARSDFDRTEHQRQIMLALKDKALTPGVIANPLKVGQLFDSLGTNVKTDLKPSEVRRLYDLGKQTNSRDIQSLSLNDANGVNLLASYSSAASGSALIPAAGIDDFSQIQLYLKKIMTSDPVVQESAKVVVLNGGNLTGLALQESNALTGKGMNVVATGDAPTQDHNTIIDQSHGSKPATKAKLQSLFGVTPGASSAASDYPDADFIITLGTNQPYPQ